MSDAPKLTDVQKRALVALSRKQLSASADDIASVMGYRPARSGRLAVTSALRRLLYVDKDVGLFVYRIPPRDQWGCAYWGVTKEGRDLAAENLADVVVSVPAGPRYRKPPKVVQRER